MPQTFHSCDPPNWRYLCPVSPLKPSCHWGRLHWPGGRKAPGLALESKLESTPVNAPVLTPVIVKIRCNSVVSWELFRYFLMGQPPLEQFDMKIESLAEKLSPIS